VYDIVCLPLVVCDGTYVDYPHPHSFSHSFLAQQVLTSSTTLFSVEETSQSLSAGLLEVITSQKHETLTTTYDNATSHDSLSLHQDTSKLDFSHSSLHRSRIRQDAPYSSYFHLQSLQSSDSLRSSSHLHSTQPQDDTTSMAYPSTPPHNLPALPSSSPTRNDHIPPTTAPAKNPHNL
jgi:hypothetical protein